VLDLNLGSPHQTSKIVRLGTLQKPYRQPKAKFNTFLQREMLVFSVESGSLQKPSFVQAEKLPSSRPITQTFENAPSH
jgi:hypothetical protein